MVGFLCFFFPPVIAVAVLTKLRKSFFRYDQYLGYYAIFVVIINGIMFWILSFMFDPHYISASDVFTTSFSARYLLLSSILAVFSAYFMEIIRKFKPPSTEMKQENSEAQKTADKDG